MVLLTRSEHFLLDFAHISHYQHDVEFGHAAFSYIALKKEVVYLRLSLLSL